MTQLTAKMDRRKCIRSNQSTFYILLCPISARFISLLFIYKKQKISLFLTVFPVGKRYTKIPYFSRLSHLRGNPVIVSWSVNLPLKQDVNSRTDQKQLHNSRAIVTYF